MSYYLAILIILQAHASNLAAAHRLFEKNQSLINIAVGGKHYYIVPEEEMATAHMLLNAQPPTFAGNSGGYSVRSIYIPQHGCSGVLYRVNEHVYISDSINSGNTFVIKISKIFSLLINEETYCMFVSGFKYVQSDTHLSSGNPIVKETAETVTIKGQDIMRKVMIYPMANENDTSNFIVIDYERPIFPLLLQDILVPQYPQVGDMVAVNGENDETWLAHVQHINQSSKYCQVHFYIPDRHNDKLYRKEHHRLEKVYWSSILRLIPGTWLDDYQYLIHNSIC